MGLGIEQDQRDVADVDEDYFSGVEDGTIWGPGLDDGGVSPRELEPWDEPDEEDFDDGQDDSEADDADLEDGFGDGNIDF